MEFRERAPNQRELDTSTDAGIELAAGAPLPPGNIETAAVVNKRGVKFFWPIMLRIARY
jgi:hypothetical protein